MKTSKPGTPVKNSKTGRPIMVLLDLLSRRWALRVLWELHQNGPCSFRNLQKLCGDISPTVLNSRIKELREAGIIALREKQGYIITREGLNLGKIISQLNGWAKNWSKRAESGHKMSSMKRFPSKTKIKK